jgi:hypothetical protein
MVTKTATLGSRPISKRGLPVRRGALAAAPFAFSAAERRDLKFALGREDAEFCRWLAERVGQYKADSLQARVVSDVELRDWMSRTRDLASTLAHHLRKAEHTDREYYLTRFLDWGVHERETFGRSLWAIPEAIERAFDEHPPIAHRPKDWTRLYLETAVAEVMAARGYRVTKGRDGAFARVLAVVHRAAGISSANDLFRSVRSAVDRMQRRVELYPNRPIQSGDR